MAKEKEPDSLTRAATAALEAGMSYGKWMALHEGELKKKQKPKRDGVKFVCQYCGKTFIRYDTRKRKYCDDECREKASNLREIEKYHQRKIDNKENKV